MKKFLAFLTAFLILLGTTPFSEVKAAENERRISPFLYWIITPVDYYGELHVFLHSDSDPEGTCVPKLKPFYQNDTWNVYALLDENLSDREENYWATISTDVDGITPGYVAAIYPDLEERSIIPNINTSITSRYYEFSTVTDANIATTNPIGRYIKDTSFANGFFGYIVPTEMVSDVEDNLNELYTNLMKEYIQKVSTTRSMVTAKSNLYHNLVPAGHFDDYVTLFLPLEVSCAEYANWTRNWLLWDLMENNTTKTSVGILLMPQHQSKADDYVYTNDGLVVLHEMFGWEIYYDPSDIAFTEVGGLATDLVFPDSENAGANAITVKIPALDGTTIPEGSVFPIIGDFEKHSGINPKDIKELVPTNVIGNYTNIPGTVPTTSPENPNLPHNPTTGPSGSESEDRVEIVEKIPTKTPENTSTKTPTTTPTNTPAEPTEEAGNILPIVLILLGVLGVGGIGFIVLKKKK